MKKSSEDKFFKDLMAGSRLKLPFPDFEDEVMMKIEENIEHRERRSVNLRLSWIFFILGSLFGVVLTFLLPAVLPPLFGLSPENLAQIIQILIVVLILTQLDELLRFTREFKVT